MSIENEHPLLLIDGSSWLFRAYHALPPLTSPSGQPTGAVRGFSSMLKRLMKDFAPRRICVVFDPSGPVFRNEMFADYKANRDETPEDLSAQFPVVSRLIKAMSLPLMVVDGVEADDVIGTLTRQARARGDKVVIVTSDKDMAQLVDDHVQLLDTMKNRLMGPEGVVEKFGVPPERIIDWLALVGDSVDNIPGVPGVGPKTATKWLNEYGSLDGVRENANNIGGKIGEKLRAALPGLDLSHQLATIRCDVDLPMELDELVPGEPDREALALMYRELGFHRDLEELGGAAALPQVPESADEAASATPAQSAEPTQAICVLEQAQFDDMVAALQTAELISFDTETDSLDANQARLVGLAFAVKAGQGWYLPLQHQYLDVPPQLDLKAVLERLRPVLEDAQRPKLAQHGKYDINVLHWHGVDVQGLRYDSMLESYVLDAAGSRHDMDTLAERHLGVHTIKFSDVAGKGRNQLTFDQVDVHSAANYSAEDADITLRLHQALYPQLSAQNGPLKVFETLEMPLVPVLARMEQTGVGVDVPLLRKISEELAGRMEELQAEAFKIIGESFNLGSPKQLQVLLFDKLGLRVVARTPKGDPSTSEEVLEELAQEHPLPRLILDWRAMQKLRSTYAENLPNSVNPKTGRIHTSYHQAVAATGRLSSSDPNLQNIPVRTAEGRRIRQAFIAPPDQRLLSIDYSQIELRLMAHFSGDPLLQKAFREGLDIHRATAAEVFGVALEQVQSEHRRAAKAINFGLIYGMSAFGLARNLGIGRSEAGEYIERFFGRYPGVREFMEAQKLKAREQGYVETLMGRRLYLPNINARNAAQRQYAERTAINAPLQGTAADLIKLAMLDVDRWLSENGRPVQMIMQVHDELVFEGAAAAIEALAPTLARRMVNVMSLQVPLVADYGIGAQWDASHDKLGSASS